MELEEELNFNIFNILNSLILIIKKYKKVFFLFLFLNLFLTSIYNYSKKDIYVGKSILALNFEDEKNFINKELDKSNPPIKMEKLNYLVRNRFEILNSKTILEPIHLFYSELSINNKKNKIDNYELWRKNFELNLIRGTSLLEIKYKSDKKETIYPIIEKSLNIINNYTTNSKLAYYKKVLNKLKVSVPILEDISIQRAKDLDTFLFEKNINKNPELLRDYYSEKKLVDNKKEQNLIDTKNSKLFTFYEKRNSTQLKKFNSIDLVKLSRLQFEFEKANERYINSLQNKNELENALNYPPIDQNFQDSISIKKIGGSSISLFIKSFSITTFIIFLIFFLKELKDGTIFNADTFQNLLQEKPLLKLFEHNKEDWSKLLNLIFNKRSSKEKLTVFCLGKFPENFINYLNSIFPDILIFTSKKSSDLKIEGDIITIFHVGETTKNQILNLKTILNLKNIKKINYFLYEDSFFF